jgi:indole-3-glycerol phosphate synthase
MTIRPPSLEEIIAHKRKQVDQLKVVTPLNSLRALAKMQDRPRDVSSYLREHRVALLARVLNPAARKLADERAQKQPYDPVALARRLVRAGAQALVISTDELYHGGSVAHLTLASSAVDVPVIRADYILDEYQIVETRAAGADGLILTPGLLDDNQLFHLVSAIQRNLMTVVAKVHGEDELRRVLPYEPRVIALDNRHSVTGAVDLSLSSRLLPLIPRHMTVVTMGGILTPADLARVLPDMDGVLVNQELLMAPETAAAIRQLLGIADIPNDVSGSGTSSSTPPFSPE